jgi:hypothetical protein
MQNCPLNPLILDTREEDGMAIEKSLIATEPGILVPPSAIRRGDGGLAEDHPGDQDLRL